MVLSPVAVSLPVKEVEDGEEVTISGLVTMQWMIKLL